ncbi:LamG domain-containing protein, partial [Bacteroidales bacterium]|nr:LamG domain-containing protein [Bacteroidales bacterium]
MRRIIVLSISIVLSMMAYTQPGDHALELDGVDDYVSLGTDVRNIFTRSNSFSVEMWINTTETGQDVLLATMDHNGTTYPGVHFSISSGGLRLLIANNGISNRIDINTTSTVINDGKWHHVAFSYDGTSSANGVQIYVDGEVQAKIVVGNNLSASIVNSSGECRLGSRCQSFAYGFLGKLDEVRIWDDVRTVSELNSNMHKELAGNESELVAYYQMSDGGGASLSDNHTINNNIGTLTNMNNLDWVLSGCFSGPGNCLDFDGGDDNVWVNSLSSTVSGQGSITFWINLTAYPDDNARVISNGPDYNTGDEIYISNGTGTITTINLITGNDLSSTNQLVIGEWTHVAITADGTGSKLYINGELDDEGGAANFSFSTFRFGGQYTAGFWECLNGKLDEVCLWSDVRTEDEIRKYMSQTLDGDESGLVAYYRLDQTQGTIAYDITGNGNNGSLGGMVDADWVASSAFNTWLGGESSVWTAATNWSKGSVPSGESVGIYNWSVGNNPALSGTPIVNNIYIESGVTIPGSVPITAGGNIYLNGAISLPSNVTSSTIGGNLEIGSGGLLSMLSGSKLTVTGDMINAGTVNLFSPASTNPSASLITNGILTNTGTMTIQRWASQGSIDGDNYNWHSMGLPITSALTGDYFTGDYLYVFDESANNWSNVIPTGTGLSRTQGLLIKPVSGDKTYTFNGTFNTGTINTSTLANTGSGYHMVSNPYPSPIDLEAIGRTNIGTTFWIWD